MILIVGGLGAGKKTYAREHLGFPEAAFVDAAEIAAELKPGVDVRNEVVDNTANTVCGGDAFARKVDVFEIAAELKPCVDARNDFRRGRILSDPTSAMHDEISVGSIVATDFDGDSSYLVQPCAAGELGRAGTAVSAANSASPSLSRHAVTNAEELVRTMSVRDAAAVLEGFGAVLLHEVGSGIVPVDAGEREWRERAGRLGCLLAAKADAVVRVTCGIGRVIKGGSVPPVYEDEADTCSGHAILSEGRRPKPKNLAGCQRGAAACATSPLRVTLIRHGATAGTENRRYCGAGTDELLSEEGMRQVRSLEPDSEVELVFTSGLLRCDETARALFPNAVLVRVPELAEMDFGAFEGKNYTELADDAAYQSWVDSWCETQCPGGESKALFTERVCAAFAELAAMEGRQGAERLVCVCHAGTIRALLATLAKPAMPYFDIETDVLGSWSAIWDGERLIDVTPIRGARLK